MLQFMAWERSFEKRVLAIREKELKYQKLNYTIEVCSTGVYCRHTYLSNLDLMECYLVLHFFSEWYFGAESVILGMVLQL